MNIRSSSIKIQVVFVWILGLCLSGTMVVSGQTISSPFLIPGPEKTLVLTGEIVHETSRQFTKPGECLLVYRSDDEAGEVFSLIGETSFPENARIFRERLEQIGATELLLQQLKVRNTNQAYQVLTKTSPDTLGFLMLSPEIGEALGLLYIDRDRNPLQKSVYRIDKQDKNQKVLHSVTQTIEGGLPTVVEHFQPKTFLQGDSSVSITWSAPISANEQELPLFLHIYKRTQHGEDFRQHRKLLISASDSIPENIVYITDDVTPGQHLAYYVQAEDFAGNKGPLSDTLYMLAINPSAIGNIENFQVLDTLDGLLLTWDPLPADVTYSAIEIMKSRELGTDYVSVDTIPATHISYLDHRVIPSTAYYYRIRPLVTQVQGLEPLIYIEATGHKSGEGLPNPAAPRNVTATLDSVGVRLQWIQGDETNLFAYYVLRGTHPDDMIQISGAVQDITFTDSINIRGYTGQMHYAVLAMDQAQQLSDTSDIASVFLQQPIELSAPNGIQARRTIEGAVWLEWDDVSIRDEQVHGFHLYRRQPGESDFSLLNDELLSGAFYTDSTASESESYEYAVASADLWGNQSAHSPSTTLVGDVTTRLLPPSALYARNLRTGIEISWPTPLTGDTEIRYVIYRKEKDQSEFQEIGESRPDTPYLDRSVQPGLSYEYAIRVRLLRKGQTDQGGLSAPAAVRRIAN